MRARGNAYHDVDPAAPPRKRGRPPSTVVHMPPLLRVLRVILHGRPEHWREAAGAMVHLVMRDEPETDTNGNIKWLDEPNSRLRRHARARMTRTGESFAVARAQLIAGRSEPKPRCVCQRGRACAIHPCPGGFFPSGRCTRCGRAPAAHQ